MPQGELAGGRIERIAVDTVTDKAFVEALRCWQEAPDGGTPEGAIRLLEPLCDSATQLRLTPVERGAPEHDREPSAHRVQGIVDGRLLAYERLTLPFFEGDRLMAFLTLSRLKLVVEDVAAPRIPSLSPRERQCLGLLASGYSAKRIAAKLGLTPKTVEQHILHLKRKLKARNVAQAVAKGMVATLLPAPR
ncbi:helix-turn-helix transcriptional regulator [Azospirillum sp. TSO22-1]|uniref:helix-turn-helix transcriptional regulator n=1 Tax=Azospirillum sp. TSO22-1 TaxID=716789 RepID=UPI0018EE6CEA|nr:helix-turn-helix transcriptional regulator [Azospirillum sp. TSO22-1]